MSEDGDQQRRAKLKKVAKYGAWAGLALSMVCHLLPAKYHVVCQFFSKLLTGGL